LGFNFNLDSQNGHCLLESVLFFTVNTINHVQSGGEFINIDKLIVRNESYIGPIGKLSDHIDKCILDSFELLFGNAEIHDEQVTLPVFFLCGWSFKLQSSVCGHEFMRQLSWLNVFRVIWRQACNHTADTALDGFCVKVNWAELVEYRFACTCQRIVFNLANVWKL